MILEISLRLIKICLEEKMKRSLLVLMVLLLVSFAAFAGGEQEKGSEVIKISVAHGVPEETAEHQGFLKFQELLEAESNGRYKVEIYPNQQLGGDRELIESVQLGNLTITGPSSAPLASFANGFYVLDLPFLFADRDEVYRVLDGEPGQALLASLEQYNLKGLGFMENGFRNITNSKREIKSPADLAGLKIRTMENELHLAAWKQLGANPTPMAFGEVFTALQQKTVDGQENPFELIASNRFYEVQDYITATKHIYSPYVVVMNKEFYDGLSADDQKLFNSTMKRAIDFQRVEALKAESTSLETILASGTKVTELDKSEVDVFREKLVPMREKVKAKAGDDIVDLFISAIQ